MPSYDSSRFDPPAAVAEVTLRDAPTGTCTPVVPMLIDTGADITLIPRMAVERLGIRTRQTVSLDSLATTGDDSLPPLSTWMCCSCGESSVGPTS